jgi:hypothetical protein
VARALLCIAALAAFSLLSRADDTVASPETVITLTVQPMAAPTPALRYLLLPELKELNPGNPIQGYLRCFTEQSSSYLNKEACERRDQLLSIPSQDLSGQELQDYGKFDLRQADWAARLDKPDWQILLQLKTEGVSLLLPDLQQMRNLANALKVRFRAEVAMRRFDDALRTAKTLFALSRQLGEHPTFIGDLVGIAVAFVAIGPLEEMLEQPGCPNLYWALTNLPRPFIRLDKGAEGERASIQGELRDLDDSAPMSADRLTRFIAHMDLVLGDGKPVKPGESRLRAWLDARTKDRELVSAARRRLNESGLPEERLLRFPADQVILLDQKREYEVRRDDLMKLLSLPSWQIKALGGLTYQRTKEPAVFADAFVPALHRVHHLQGRLEQRIALLRHVEALRLYAAEHNALPAKLSEISVPLPADPFTGKPFCYELRGSTAHLRGSPPAGEEKNPIFNVHYEVTLEK